MQCLNKQLIPEEQRFDHLPERIIQFGEGNFLRGFIDWMVHQLNKKGRFNGRVVAIQPTPHGQVVPKLNAQDGLYTLVLRGIENEKTVDQAEVISSISRGINPYEQWPQVLELAENPEIQFVFSNTTEAGLTYFKEAYDPEQSPLSFPGKLTAFLYHRFRILGDGGKTAMAIIPCELLENNGDRLKEIVLKIARDWRLPAEFVNWVDRYNRFCNTLVDRIVTGYPKDHIDEYRTRLGYDDRLLTVGEPYHLFAIEADDEVAAAIPFHEAGVNVHWTEVKPLRESKVRILNGAHTLMVPVAILAGRETVLEAMEDELLQKFIRKAIYQEIMPVLDSPPAQKQAFSDAVIERFLNPFTKHYLGDIALNSFSKFKARLLPTLLETAEKHQRLPKAITFSLAALIFFYQGKRTEESVMACRLGDREYTVREQPQLLAFLEEVWSGYEGKEEQLMDITKNVLAHEGVWGQSLLEVPGLSATVFGYLSSISQRGMAEALGHLLEGE